MYINSTAGINMWFTHFPKFLVYIFMTESALSSILCLLNSFFLNMCFSGYVISTFPTYPSLKTAQSINSSVKFIRFASHRLRSSLHAFFTFLGSHYSLFHPCSCQLYWFCSSELSASPHTFSCIRKLQLYWLRIIFHVQYTPPNSFCFRTPSTHPSIATATPPRGTVKMSSRCLYVWPCSSHPTSFPLLPS